MKNKKIITAFLCFVLSLMIIPVRIDASAAGIYTATVTPSYAHPVTGEIEDSGNNAGIGQPMTESVLAGSGLVEIDSKGNTYVTLRINMMDQIESVSISVQATSSSSWKSASLTTMQKSTSNNTCDYRFTVPSQSAIMKITTYVSAMGRSVIFYGTLSNLKSGSSDFVTTLTDSDINGNTSSESSSSSNTNSSTSSGSSSNTGNSSSSNAGSSSSTNSQSGSNSSSDSTTTSDSTTSNTSSSTASIIESTSDSENTSNTANSQSSSNEGSASDGSEEITEDTTEDSAEESESSGLEIYTKSEDTSDAEEAKDETEEPSSESNTLNYNLILIILCVIAGFDLLLSIIFIFVYLMRKRNQSHANKEKEC